MAKESGSGLGVGQRYGALLDTSEVRSNKTEGGLNEAVFYVTPDLQGRKIVTQLPKNAVVLSAAWVDVSTETPITGTGAPITVDLTRNGVGTDTITVDGGLSTEITLTNVAGSAGDPDADTLELEVTPGDVVSSGQTTITVRYFNQRNK